MLIFMQILEMFLKVKYREVNKTAIYILQSKKITKKWSTYAKTALTALVRQ
jgi:hypothetical protein